MRKILAALALLIAAIGLYLRLPALHLHALHPWPVYLLLALALGVALRSDTRLAVRGPVAALCLVIGVAFVGYHEAYSRIEMPEMNLRVGEQFPEFTLPTSQGPAFASTSLLGSSRALYVFYRGDW